MNSVRIKMLEQFVAEDPSDPFNHYALALELLKSDKPHAKEIFDRLLALHPQYVPTYYQLALLNLELEKKEEATQVIEKGIAEAKRQNNVKAANELRAFLDEVDD